MTTPMLLCATLLALAAAAQPCPDARRSEGEPTGDWTKVQYRPIARGEKPTSGGISP
jgi:hypothetical protein